MSTRRWLSAPVIRAIDHLEDGIGRPASLAEMAAAAGLSPYHFHRRFREETGETPAAFAERLRLERAALLLLADTIPITHLAWDVGFRNPETFARRFRARFGITARDYRKRQLGLWRELGLTAGEDPGGSPGEIEARRLERLDVAVLRSLGDDDGFRFDPGRAPWSRLVEEAPSSLIGATFDWSGITPPEYVRQDWGCPAAEASPRAEVFRRTLPGGQYAMLVAGGSGPVPITVHQRLYVWSLGGRYRLRPGALLEIRRERSVHVYQPVFDTREDSAHVRV